MALYRHHPCNRKNIPLAINFHNLFAYMQNNSYLCRGFIFVCMKKTFLVIMVGCMLMACHSDIDLYNIDTTAQVEMGVAVPVGRVRAQLGDFIGDIENLYVDSANGGVLTVRIGYEEARDYHKFDLRQHVSVKDDTLNVYNNLDAANLLLPDGTIKGTGYGVAISAPLHFDFPIILNGINKILGKERLDSALIEYAQFASTLDTTELPLQWEWIDSVQLVLGSSVYRPAGNKKTIYRKGGEGGYKQKLSIGIDNFSISLMKNKNLNIEKNNIVEYAANVDSMVTFGMDIHVTIPASAGPIKLSKKSKFNCRMEVEFIDYKAIWGYFDPDKDMISKQVEVDLEPYLGQLSYFKGLNTPFTDPRIDVAVTTHIAGAMTLRGKNVYVVRKDGDSIFATFNGKRERTYHMANWMHPDPNKPFSAIGDSITDTIPFSNKNEEGRIDRLFAKLPKKLGYDFYVDFDGSITPQIRITPDTRVHINAICTLPMKFRDSLLVDYLDTIHEVNFSAVNIDSLIRESQIIDSLRAGEVTLYATALSEIPVSVKAVLTFLDKNGQPLADPTDPSKPFTPFLEDTLRINPPHYEKNSWGQWMPVDKGKSVFTAHMSMEKLKMVPDVKHIAYRVIIDNEALNYAFKANPGLPEVQLKADQHVELNLGLTAQIDAILNFNSKQ